MSGWNRFRFHPHSTNCGPPIPGSTTRGPPSCLVLAAPLSLHPPMHIGCDHMKIRWFFVLAAAAVFTAEPCVIAEEPVVPLHQCVEAARVLRHGRRLLGPSRRGSEHTGGGEEGHPVSPRRCADGCRVQQARRGRAAAILRPGVAVPRRLRQSEPGPPVAGRCRIAARQDSDRQSGGLHSSGAFPVEWRSPC